MLCLLCCGLPCGVHENSRRSSPSGSHIIASLEHCHQLHQRCTAAAAAPQSPPTFDACVEMVSREQWRVHVDVGWAVDSLLVGKEAGK